MFLVTHCACDVIMFVLVQTSLLITYLLISNQLFNHIIIPTMSCGSIVQLETLLRKISNSTDNFAGSAPPQNTIVYVRYIHHLICAVKKKNMII